MAAPRPTCGHYQGGSLIHSMLITCVLHIPPEGYREPRSEVGSLWPAEHLVGFEPGTFLFWSKRLNPIGHSLQNLENSRLFRAPAYLGTLCFTYIQAYSQSYTLGLRSVQNNVNKYLLFKSGSFFKSLFKSIWNIFSF